MKYNLPNGVVYEGFADGSIKLTTKDGAELTIDPDGKVSANLKLIRNVGIKSLVDVESYLINEVYGSRSHVIRFFGGGVARFAYNAEGKLIELGGECIGTTLTPDGDVIFSRGN